MEKLNKLMTTGLLIGFIFAGNVGQQTVVAETPNKEIKVVVDGNSVTFPDSKPFVDKKTNRTLVPIRFISEKLGAKVEWDDVTKTVTMVRESRKVWLKVGENDLYVGDECYVIDSPAVIVNGRTFVPLRSISQAFEVYVKWDGSKQLVTVETDPVIHDITGKDFPVANSNPTFQTFHQGLTIKNGILTGKVPKVSHPVVISFVVNYKSTSPIVVQSFSSGDTFSIKVKDIKAMGITVTDRGKKQTLASYAYRSLPDLMAVPK